MALDFAVHADRLMPITSMKNRPGNPEDVIIFYGAASSIVEFMILKYGPDKMLTLLTEHKSGMNLDDAIEYVYGIDKLSLENDWRSYIGAPKYEPDLSENELPTPIPRPTVGLFSLTPQAGSISIASTENDDSVVANVLDVTSTPETKNAEVTKSSGCNRYGGTNQSADYSMLLLLIPHLLIYSRRK